MDKIAGFVSLKISRMVSIKPPTDSKLVNICVLQFFSRCFHISCVAYHSKQCIDVYEGYRDFIME